MRTTSLDDEDFASILRDPRAPYGVALRMGGVKPILVSEAMRLARLRLGDYEDLEQRFDEYVDRIGGAKREPISISLDHLTRRLIRRLSGRFISPPGEIYEIPASFFRRG